jgi:hypothetical protein
LKVLLDHNVSEHLKPLLPEHTVHATWDRRGDGWDRLKNGALLRVAEADLFEVMLTGDKGIYHQHNHAKRRISLVVVSTTKWEILQRHLEVINAAIIRATPGSYEYVVLEPEQKGKRSKR